MSQTQHDRSQAERERLERINSRTGRNMPQAVATGTILVILVVASIVFVRSVFVMLCIVFMVLALWELRVDFATAGIRIPVVALWCGAVFTLALTYFYPRHVAGQAIGVMTSILLAVIFASMQRRTHVRVSDAVAKKLATARLDGSADVLGGTVVHDAMTHIGASVFAVMYVIFLASFIVLPLTMGHPVAHAFMIVFLPALGDIGGLFFGAAFGKHKLSPRISPKKSWEGLFGSVLFSLIGAMCIGLGTYSLEEFSRNWWVLAILGAMVGVTGLFGDLCASMIKRDLGIKDMGHLLRGHGGVLDRVDSILISAPFVTFVIAVGAL